MFGDWQLKLDLKIPHTTLTDFSSYFSALLWAVLDRAHLSHGSTVATDQQVVRSVLVLLLLEIWRIQGCRLPEWAVAETKSIPSSWTLRKRPLLLLRIRLIPLLACLLACCGSLHLLPLPCTYPSISRGPAGVPPRLPIYTSELPPLPMSCSDCYPCNDTPLCGRS